MTASAHLKSTWETDSQTDNFMENLYAKEIEICEVDGDAIEERNRYFLPVMLEFDKPLETY